MLNGQTNISKFLIMLLQEAMENFVFPDENKTKLIKMKELMNIFPILIGIPQKKLQKVFFIYTGKTVKNAFTF